MTRLFAPIALTLVWTLGACNRDGGDTAAAPDEGSGDAAEAKGDAPAPTEADLPATAATAEGLAVGLQTALDLGVLAPPRGGTTYRLDPFVPALVAAAVERHGKAWFSDYVGTPAKVDYQVAGYQANAAAVAAGLGELGLVEGDIVQEINGVPAANPGEIRAALAGTDEGLTIGVFRDDYTVVLSYVFDPGLAWRRTLEGYGGGTVVAAAPGASGEDDVDAVEPAAAGGDDEPRGDGGTPVPDPRTSPPASAGGGSKPSAGGGGSKPSSGGGAALPPSTSGGGGSKTPGSGTSQVSCSSADSCTIRRAYFDSMTSSPSKLESQSTIVPAIRNDVFSGYKLKWVRPGSSIAQLGFKADDKITHINGKDLTDDSQAFALYLSRSSTKVYKVRYERGGATRTKTITVV